MPILRKSSNSLDITSSSASALPFKLFPPLLPTPPVNSPGFIRQAASTQLRDNNPEEHHRLSSLGLLAPPLQGHRQGPGASTETVSSISGSSTDRDINCSPGLRLGPARSDHSDLPNTHPSPNTHMDARSSTSRHWSAASSFTRTVRRVRRPSPSTSGDTDMGYDMTPNFIAPEGDHADVKPSGTETVRTTVLEIKQEVDLNVEPFAFKPLQLAGLVDPKSLENLQSLGGVEVLLRGLGTDRSRGLNANLNAKPTRRLESSDLRSRSPDLGFSPHHVEVITSPLAVSLKSSASVQEATIEDRQRIYGKNILPQRPRKSLLRLMWMALRDKVIVLLSLATAISLALGIFQDFGTRRPEGEPPVDWVAGVAIMATILIVVGVGSLNDWQKERQFQVLNEKKEDRLLNVIRDGGVRQVHVQQVVVGDVVLLEPGEVIACDGVFLSGHNMWCDESSTTGESDAVKKLSYEECIALRDKQLMEFDTDPSADDESVKSPQRKTDSSGLEFLAHVDCFVISGRALMSYLDGDSENTPLQLKLNDLAEAITMIGSIAGGLFFVALLVHYFFQPRTTNTQRTPSEMGSAFVSVLNIAVTLVVVALPEGLPLAVTLALVFATKQMAKDNLLVRVLSSCETMANASVICTDKTGTLSQNDTSVVAGTIGVDAKFVRGLEKDRERKGGEARSDLYAKDFGIDLDDLNTVLPHQLKGLFNAAIAINSTAFEDVDTESGAPVFIGNKTESALLGFAKGLGWQNYKVTRDSADIIQIVPFSSDRKFMGTVVRLPDGSHRLYVKGASEVLTRNCKCHVVMPDSASSADEVETAPIGEREEDSISHTITFYASQALRMIALCYRDFPSWPPEGAQLLDKGQVDYGDLMTDLTLIGIIGIEDPLRPDVREAVANCGKAGVAVKMCTGDNVFTARSIAQQCGIYTAGGIVMGGPYFRALSPGVMKAIVPRLQVLALSSPEDKHTLVATLKELGDVVGVTGAGGNDGPALETAHVGFSMGVSGTQVAKEASDIVLMDDNFSSIVNAIMWGRCVNDSVRKFLQFQISTNVTAVVVMFVWVLASSSEDPVLSSVQLLWINLIMGSFAALALATDRASPAQLDRKPNVKTDPLITIDMTKQILGQAVYQVVVILAFHFLGFHHIDSDDSTLQRHHDDIVQTLVFNVFVFAQIFNSFNCRRLDRKLNVFEGITKNWYFMTITTIEVAIQVSICLFGGSAFSVTRIGAREWVISLAFGCVSLPLGALIRLTHNEPCERAFKKLKLLPTSELLPTTRTDAESCSSSAIDHARINLHTFVDLRRGCMHGPSLVRKRRSFADPNCPRLALEMVSSLDGGASPVVAHDSQPCASGSLSDPRFDTSRSSATLWENAFEVHPDTPRDDPVYGLLGMT
ncbi:hypothetical protein EI94DRAFT_1801308 [Lactarius quietus]|nr:hypothetical protein EI94DRAFT_1801308 [Lactarius quietus]